MGMLGAMALVGVVDVAIRMSRPAAPSIAPDSDKSFLAQDSPKQGMSYNQKVLVVAAPAAFDLLATGLCCMGMVYIPASIWQMLKGGSIIFCGILSVTFLKRKLYAFHWTGLLLVVSGLCTVGLSSVLSSSESNSNSTGELIFGMTLVMMGQVVQAAQVIAEEWLMKDVDLRGMEVVGWEGFWGTLMMIIIVYPLLWIIPGSDHGHAEDVVDTFVMIKNSLPLFLLVLLYLISCGSFNASGIAVTGALSATHRMMMDASRTSVIWFCAISVHYGIDQTSPMGEALTPYSFLQLVGFIVLVTGQAIYGEIFKVPGLYYPPKPPSTPVDQQKFCSPGALLVASPLPSPQPE